MAHVVEHHQHVAHHQGHVGQPDRVRVGIGEWLHRAHQVVPEEADRATRERGQIVQRGQAERRQVLAHGAVRIVDLTNGDRLGVGGDVTSPLA